MQTLNIVAANPESARELLGALSEFRVELVHGSNGSYEVTVRLGGSDREIIEILSAVEAYVADGGRAAEIHLDGREYVMHPEPAA